MRQKLGRIAAWMLTVGLLGYLFWKIPASEMVRALQGAAGWTVPVLALLVGCIYVLDSLAMWKTFNWFVAPLRYGEVLIIRGATYLLAMVNYTLGQGGIVYFVHRSRGVPVMRGAAAVLLIMGTNVLLLLFMATVGVAFGAETVPALKTILIVGYAGLTIYTVAVVAKPGWLARRPLFDVLLTAGVRGYLKAVAIRIPHTMSLVAVTYAALHAFRVEVPLVQALLYLPVVFFVSPISVQGLGSTQAAMVFFFARYAPAGDLASREAAVFAASLACQAVAIMVQVCISLVCLRSQVARDLRQVPAPS